jgi:methylmalonyl-CoA/ethylmalonyl-CoA epimerase
MDPTSPLPPAQVDQVGIVVDDLQAMAENLHRLLGIGPFRVVDWPIEGIDPQSTYYGEPASYKIRIGFAWAGKTQIELVQPVEGPNIWSDFLERHGPGIHHFRMTVPDFEVRVAALEAAGFRNMASGTGAHIGSEWVYLDTSEVLQGLVIELRKRLEGESGEGQWATAGEQVGA